MTVEIASQMLNCSTSHDLWKSAKDLAGAYTRSRVTLYKSEFQRTKKGSMSMESYLSKMKTISNNLALAGSPLSMTDIITQVLACLDSD